MEVSDFFYFFSKNKNRFLENGYILNEDIGFDGPGFQKKSWDGGRYPPTVLPLPHRHHHHHHHHAPLIH